MFKLLAGAVIGFAAAWFMDTQEGERRRAAAKEKAAGFAGKGKEQAADLAGKGKEQAADLAGKGKEQAAGAVQQVKDKAASSQPDEPGNGGGSYEAASAGQPIAESEPTSAPGPETFKQS